MNRKRLLLAALLGLLVLSIAYAFWAMPRQEQAPPRTATPAAAAKAATPRKAGPAPAGRLHLGLLAQTEQPFPGARRDIFRFRSGWAPPVDIPPPSPPPVVEEAPPPPPPPPTAQEILQQKVGRFTFLGFLQKGQAKTVFLSSGGELYLVKAGDSFGRDGDLTARQITDSELVVGTREGTETVRVKLVEKQALKPGLVLPGGGGSTLQQKALPAGLRQGGASFPGRRAVQQQRLLPQPAAPPTEAGAEQDSAQEEQPAPDDGGTQEEPPQEEPSGGEGDGDKE